MKIPRAFHQKILAIDVNSHSAEISYGAWKGRFAHQPDVLNRISAIEESIGDSVCRKDVVQLFRKSKVDDLTRFIACMIWGYAASEGGRADNRGPYRVEQVLALNPSIREILKTLSVNNREDIRTSYAKLEKITRLGQSFLTKYLYFLGLARGSKIQPLILDRRVAVGLAKVAGLKALACSMIEVAPRMSAAGYESYLAFAHDQANEIRCRPDQIEYFLFSLGRDS